MSFLGSFSRWSPLSTKQQLNVKRSSSSVDFGEYMRRNSFVTNLSEDEETTIYDHTEVSRRRFSISTFDPPSAEFYESSGVIMKPRALSCTSIPENDLPEDADNNKKPVVSFALDDLEEVEEEAVSSRQDDKMVLVHQVMSEHESCHSTEKSDSLSNGSLLNGHIQETRTSSRNKQRGLRKSMSFDGRNTCSSNTILSELTVDIPSSDNHSLLSSYRHMAQSPVVNPLEQFIHLKVERDQYMSPMFADDSLLSRMPPTIVVVSSSTMRDLY